jgi:indole-3-glycerol phosphate synthase
VLSRRGEVAVIAEFKRRSPSAGVLSGAEPAEVARAYAAGGAAAMSVLTDGPFFGGSLEDLGAARGAMEIPVLRKDFVVDEVQIWEARAAGADAVLLIVRILDDVRLSGFLDLCRELRFACLVEVHDAGELERALAVGSPILGINNRDLDTLRTDRAVSLELGPRVPADRVVVSESGIAFPGEVEELGEAGVDAILVGEALMRAGGGAQAVARLAGRAKRDRDRNASHWRASAC